MPVPISAAELERALARRDLTDPAALLPALLLFGLSALAVRVAAGELDPYAAADELIKGL